MTEKLKKALIDFSGKPNDYAKWLIGELDATWPDSVEMEIYESLKRLANEGSNSIARNWLLEHNLTGELVVN